MIMLVSRALGLFRTPVPRPARKGKTVKDHNNDNKRRNLLRKGARAEWQQNSQAGPNTFPG